MMKASLNGRRATFLSAALLGLFSWPAATYAAPFCVSTQAVPPQCIYNDPSLCQKEAARQGGVCSVNTAEYKPSPGIGQYCLVTPSRVSVCVFPDRDTCMKEAKMRNGACVIAPGVAPFRTPDPYATYGGYGQFGAQGAYGAYGGNGGQGGQAGR